MPQLQIRSRFLILFWFFLAYLLVANSLIRPAEVRAVTGDQVSQWADDLSALKVPDDQQPLASFPGVIRVPPREWALFAGPPLGSGSVQLDELSHRLTYQVLLGESIGSNNISVRGVVGRRPEVDTDPPPDCAGVTAPNYCADSPYVGGGSPTGEGFYHLESAAGHPAIVYHGMCCNGQYWNVIWYVPEDDTTHTLTLYLEAAERVGNPMVRPATPDNTRALWPENVATAQWLLDLT